MELYEVKYVRNNLSDLVHYTNVHFDLLSYLEENRVLGPADVTHLWSKANKSEKSWALYSILETRVNAYAVMQEALRRTSQSGALQILESISRPATFGERQIGITVDQNAKLGEGPHAFLYKGKIGFRDVAVKQIKHSRSFDPDRIRVEVRKLEEIESFDYDNILRYFGHNKCAELGLLLALELCDQNLAEWVHKSKGISLDRGGLLKQAASAMKHLHSLQITHMNIRPENFLVREIHDVVRIKLTGFSCSKSKEELAEIGEITGMFDRDEQWWSSPEFLKRFVDKERKSVNKATDVFSLGCVFYFILTDGSHPFGTMPSSRINNIVNDIPLVSKEQLKHVTHFVNLIEQMTHHDPTLRPEINEILCHWSGSMEGHSSINKRSEHNLTTTVTPQNVFFTIATSNGDVDQIRSMCQLYLATASVKLADVVIEWNGVTKTALHLAAKCGHHRIVEYLLDDHEFGEVLGERRFRNVIHHCVKNTVGATSLEIENKVEILHQLISKCPGLMNNLDENEILPIHLPAVHERLLIELGNLGAKFEATNPNRSNVLHIVPWYLTPQDYHKVVEYVLEKGIGGKMFRGEDSLGRVPLQIAVQKLEVEHKTLEVLPPEVCELSFDAVDAKGNNILFYAIQEGRSVPFLEELVGKGADPKRVGVNGNTLLHWVAQHGGTEDVKEFLEKKLPEYRNKRNDDGLTPVEVEEELLGYHHSIVNIGADLPASGIPKTGFRRETNFASGNKLVVCVFAFIVFYGIIGRFYNN